MSATSSNQYPLSPRQQELLAALSSKTKPTPSFNHPWTDSADSTPPTGIQSGYFEPSSDGAPGSGQLDFGVDDSPHLDFEPDGEADDSFNLDIQGQDSGEILELPPAELHEKRKSVDGQGNDEGGGKRRESEDKTAKKPGRKPLTSEPTTKRKAQNRAAQRAFRERKEKHLKDLESKVETLEKASESVNHENGMLRAQVERLQVELKEYRRRLSWISSNGQGWNYNTAGSASVSRGTYGNNDFQFEFPKFGDLPANHIFNNNGSSVQKGNPVRASTMPSKAATIAGASNSNIPGVLHRNSSPSVSPPAQAPAFASSGNSPMRNTASTSPQPQALPDEHRSNSIDSLSGLFSPSIIEASRNASFDFFPPTTRQNHTTGQPANAVNNPPGTGVSSLYNGSSVSTTDSPASSADSHQQSSSMGTSPEPSLSSPGKKLSDFGLNPIKENQTHATIGGERSFCKELNKACGNAANPVPAILTDSNGGHGFLGSTTASGRHVNGFSWFAQQNGGEFDPVLFGGYRDPQNAIISQDFGSYFNDAFPLPDLFGSLPTYNEAAPSPAPKVDLIKQVDAAQQGEEEVVPGEDKGKLMTCNKIWDRLQSMEKFRNGEIDVDNLCTELRSKARCSEGRPVIPEKDVDRILGQTK